MSKTAIYNHPTPNNTGEVELAKRTGQSVTIIRLLTAAEADLDETGPMYRVRFEDGYEDDVFSDELSTVDAIYKKRN